MRISDWSSDVCSSDLKARAIPHAAGKARGVDAADGECARRRACLERPISRGAWNAAQAAPRRPPSSEPFLDKPIANERPRFYSKRSEEHTSELQSLMRISYAVFCLKKKKTTNQKDCSPKSST